MSLHMIQSRTYILMGYPTHRSTTLRKITALLCVLRCSDGCKLDAEATPGSALPAMFNEPTK